jgi:hypothetical protein
MNIGNLPNFSTIPIITIKVRLEQMSSFAGYKTTRNV